MALVTTNVVDADFSGTHGNPGNYQVWTSADDDPQFEFTRSGPDFVIKSYKGLKMGTSSAPILGIVGAAEDRCIPYTDGERWGLSVQPGDIVTVSADIAYGGLDSWGGSKMCIYFDLYWFNATTGGSRSRIKGEATSTNRQPQASLTGVVPADADLCVPYVRIKATVADYAEIPADAAFVLSNIQLNIQRDDPEVFRQEMHPDPYVDNPEMRGNNAGGPGTGIVAEAAYPGHEQGIKLTQKAAGTSNMSLYSGLLAEGYRIPVKPGQKLNVATEMFLTGDRGTGFRDIGLQMYTYSDVDTGNYIQNIRATGGTEANPPVGKWFTIAGTFTVPEGAYAVSPRPTVYYDTDSIPGDGVYYIGYTTVYDAATISGVADVNYATSARLGMVGGVYARSRGKLPVELAEPDRRLYSGERVELAAASLAAVVPTWHWRQVTGPEVDIGPRDNTCEFIAPDVEVPTGMRVATYAMSVDGRSRSDWQFFDLVIEPPPSRLAGSGGAFSPSSPRMVGYDRGPREIWNDVLEPQSFIPQPRYEPKLVDLGIRPDDVVFSVEPPARASRGGVYVDPETGDVYRNFGEGYNESADTAGAPRRNAYMVDPASGDILKWEES